MDTSVISKKVGNGTYALVYLLTSGEIMKQNKTCYPASIFCLIEYECLMMLNSYNMFTKLLRTIILPVERTTEDLSDHEGVPMYRDRICIIMEKCETDLAVYLAEGSNDEYNKSIITQLICAIDCMHSMRIVHRDLSSSNILIKFVNGRPIVKVADFGLSSLGFKENPLTLGTASIQFRAPEIYQFFDPLCKHNKSYYNYKSDLWSLGCIIYTIVNKEFFFNNHGMIDEGVRSYNKLRDRIAELDTELMIPTPESNIYRSLLKWNPDERVDADLLLGDLYFDTEREWIDSHRPSRYQDRSESYTVYLYTPFSMGNITHDDLANFVIIIDLELEVKAIAFDLYTRYLRLPEMQNVNRLNLMLICLIYGFTYRLPSQPPPIDDLISLMGEANLQVVFDVELNVNLFTTLLKHDKRIYRPTLYDLMIRHGYKLNHYCYIKLITSVKEKTEYSMFVNK
jgi:serine/threonine protein kinase